MPKNSKKELEEARFAINSTIRKCEKSLQKIIDKPAQKTLLTRRIKALKISEDLINKELQNLMSDEEYGTQDC
jgi:hypothetical protein